MAEEASFSGLHNLPNKQSIETLLEVLQLKGKSEYLWWLYGLYPNFRGWPYGFFQAEKHLKAHPLEKHLSECLAEWKMYIKMMKAEGKNIPGNQ